MSRPWTGGPNQLVLISTQQVIISILFPRARESLHFAQISGDCSSRYVRNASAPILRIIRGVLWSALLSGFPSTVDILGGSGAPRALDIPFVDVNEAGG